MSTDTTDIFIEMVQMHSCIWNSFSGSYHNKPLRNRAWNSISKQYGMAVTECKSFWTSLRQKFLKEKKYWEDESKVASNFKEEWPFYKKMLFLKETLKPRRTYSNLKKDLERVEDERLDKFEDYEELEELEEEYVEKIDKLLEESREEDRRRFADETISAQLTDDIEELTPNSDQRKGSASDDYHVTPNNPQCIVQNPSQAPVKPVILSNVQIIPVPKSLLNMGKRVSTSSENVPKKTLHITKLASVSAPANNSKNVAIPSSSTATQKTLKRPCLTREQWNSKIKKYSENDKEDTEVPTSIEHIEKTFNTAVMHCDEKSGTKFDSLGRYVADFLNDMPKEEANIKERLILRVLED